MLINVFSIFDSKSAVFARPFFVPSDGVAVRSFTDEVNNPESALHAHPEDYSLFRIGTFDDSIGKLVSEAQPACLCTAAACVRVPKVVAPEIVKEVA